MAVALYIRVSTEEQAREGYSISAQREKLIAYCKVHDWYDYRFYIDEGVSAKNLDRPQLKEMIKHIKEGAIDTVLVYRLDRLVRSVTDLYKLLEIFEQHGCKFKSATEVYDTSTAIGRLFITLVAAMAQWERENLGERVRMGQIEKARQGFYSAKAPFGFDKTQDDKLIINENEKKIVLDIIKKIFDGYSIRQISDYMNNSGIPPIRGYKWHIATIMDIVKNPALYGAIKWRDEIIENTHEGIITKEEFEKIQNILHGRKNFKKRNTSSIFIFQGKLICPNCGNRLASERSVYFRKKDKAYTETNHYRCQSCALNKRKAINVSEKRVEKGLIEYFSNMHFHVVPTVVEDEKEKELEALKERLRQIERQREKYQKAWATDLISDEEFTERMRETKRAMAEIQEVLKNVEIDETKNKKHDIESIKAIAINFLLNWNTLTALEKREFMNNFVDGIEFDKQGINVKIKEVSFY